MRARAGIIGGAAGGLFKLVLEQLAYTFGIYSVNTAGEFSKILFGTSQNDPLVWIIYLIVTGLVGWAVSIILRERNLDSYIASGAIIGIILWAIMNTLYSGTGIATPTWSVGIGSFIVSLITHMVLGISIAYSISRYRERVET